MSRKEQLAEYAVQDILCYLMNDFDIDWDEAMQKLYLSEIFEKLYDFETGLYLESSAYIYDLLCNELSNGKLIQNEI